MIYFRVKTIFHLMQSLLIALNSDEKGVLFIESKSLFKLEHALIKSGVYKKVLLISDPLESNKLVRLISTFSNLIWLLLISLFVRDKTNVFFTPAHNIPGSLIRILVSSQVVIFEEGNHSYQFEIDGKRNPLYRFTNASPFKKAFLKYFITYTRDAGDRLIYTDVRKLKRILPEVFQQINSKIYNLDLNTSLMNLNFKNKQILLDIFSLGHTFDASDDSCVILTQPVYNNGKMKFVEYIEMLGKAVSQVRLEKNIHIFYLKEHPRENDGCYCDFIKDNNIILINKLIPFEILELMGGKFSYGITYNSTAIHSNIIKDKVILDKNEI